jgi:hypothetical protein
MPEYPKTIEDAKNMRYGELDQYPYIEGKCVNHTDTVQKWQCLRKNGHGPSGLYCWQHAKMIKKYSTT